MRHLLALAFLLAACSPPPAAPVDQIERAVILPSHFSACAVGAPCRSIPPPYGTITVYMGATSGGTVSLTGDAYSIDVAGSPGGRVTIDDLGPYGFASTSSHVAVITQQLNNFSEWFSHTDRVYTPYSGLCYYPTGFCLYQPLFQSQSVNLYVVGPNSYGGNAWPASNFPRSFYATLN